MNFTEKEKDIVKEAIELYVNAVNTLVDRNDVKRAKKDAAYSAMNKVLGATNSLEVHLVNKNVSLLTVKEAAKILGVGNNKVYELIRGGKIPFIRIGAKTIKIPEAELMEYIQGSIKGE